MPGEAQGGALGAAKALFAAEQGQQFVLAVAGDPGDADDFPAAHVQVDVLERAAERIRVGPGQLLDLQEGVAALGLRVIGDQARGFADHQPRQFLVRALRGYAVPGHPAAAQHRGAVAQGADFAELVADEQNAAAFAGQAAQGDEQFVGLLGRQHRGWFVEDQQADVLHQAANDLHPLALADGQAVHQAFRLQGHAVALRNLADLRLQLLRRAGRGAHGQGDVLRHAQGFEQREMLEHHADPQAARLGRIAHELMLPLPDQLARVGLGHPVDDLHQGAFAGAVFTEQGMDLPGLDTQVDPVVGQATGITLGDPA